MTVVVNYLGTTMKAHRLLFLPIAILVIFATAQAQSSGDSGIIYGKDHAYALTAPKCWVLDNKAGMKDGLYAVFYPEGSSWANGTVVMYTNVGSKDANQTVDGFILGDINQFKRESPNIKITDADAVTLEKGKKALVRYFTGDANGNFEAVGYIDEPKVVLMVVLTSRNKKDFDSALPAFHDLLKSYRFISSDVVTDN
jgi:hypothetical protein